MHKRDYDLIAGALLLSQPGFTTLAEGSPMTEAKRGWLKAVHGVCDALALENPRFDKSVFLQSCGAIKFQPKNPTGIKPKGVTGVENLGRVWRP